MNLVRHIFLIFFSLVEAALAQQASGSFSMSGTVVNSVTGEPIKRAMVHLQGFRPESDVPPESQTTFTDSGGTFLFSSLAGGQYTITAQKPGFSRELKTSPESIALAANSNDIQVRLSPLATITGKVLDQDKQPVRSVSVVALTETVIDGRLLRQEGASGRTDDRGIYRLSPLNPGDYVVKVTGRTGSTNLYAGDTTPLIGLDDEGFRPVYSGGAQKLESALPIRVDAGSEARSDIAVVFERAFRIRGSLARHTPRMTVSFELLRTGEYSSPARVSLNGDTGKFEIPDVVPGSYVLRATQGGIRGEVPVNISGDDVDGLVLPLTPPVEIKVITHFVNSPPKDQGPRDLDMPSDAAGNCMVTLHPVGNTSLRDHDHFGSRAGTETVIGGVFPGTYRVGTQCFVGYPKSVLSGSSDLLLNPILTVSPGGAPPPIEVTALYGGGSVYGAVTAKSLGDGEQPWVIVAPRNGGSAVAQPLFPGNSGGERGDLMFAVSNLAPGEYAVWAIAKGEKTPFREPAFLQTLPPGISVQVDDNGRKQVTITEVVR